MSIRIVSRIKRLGNQKYGIEFTIESHLRLGTTEQTVILREEFETSQDARQQVQDVVQRHMADHFDLEPDDYTFVTENMDSKE